MYVCLCHAVNDRQIREAAADGVSSVRELQLALRLGTSCGKCVPCAREVLNQALLDQSAGPSQELLRVPARLQATR